MGTKRECWEGRPQPVQVKAFALFFPFSEDALWSVTLHLHVFGLSRCPFWQANCIWLIWVPFLWAWEAELGLLKPRAEPGGSLPAWLHVEAPRCSPDRRVHEERKINNWPEKTRPSSRRGCYPGLWSWAMQSGLGILRRLLVGMLRLRTETRGAAGLCLCDFLHFI